MFRRTLRLCLHPQLVCITYNSLCIRCFHYILVNITQGWIRFGIRDVYDGDSVRPTTFLCLKLLRVFTDKHVLQQGYSENLSSSHCNTLLSLILDTGKSGISSPLLQLQKYLSPWPCQLHKTAPVRDLLSYICTVAIARCQCRTCCNRYKYIYIGTWTNIVDRYRTNIVLSVVLESAIYGK